jgi:hypothetical protein
MAAPVKNTCPEIDKYINWIKQARTEERDLKRMSESDVFDSAVSMSNELYECIGYLESLRTSNDQLRCWGETLTDELQESANIIDDLEKKLSKYES